MKQFVSFALLAVFLTAGAASAQTGSLEERVKALEAKSEGKKEGGGATTGTGINAYFDDGLRFKSSDNTFAGRIGALAIFHYTSHGKYNQGDGKIDGFTIKQTGIEVEARLWEAFSGYVRPQFFGGTSSLFLGWVQFDKWKELSVRVGLMKVPYSQEFIEEVRWSDMPENSLVSLMIPGRDLGAMIFGTPDGGIFKYWLGVFNGNGAVGADANSDKDVALRIAVCPGARMESDIIKNLTIAVSATGGRPGRNDGAGMQFVTPATGTTFFGGPTTFESDSRRVRIGGDIVWIWGPLSVKAEFSWLKSKHEFASGDANFRALGTMAEVGFWLLGSTRLNGKRPDIKKPLFKDGGFGDVQVLGRYSRVSIGDTYEEYAGWGGSRNVDEWALGLNYYPNAYVRVSAMFVQYHYDEQRSRRFTTASGRTMDDENAFVLRAQIDF